MRPAEHPVSGSPGDGRRPDPAARNPWQRFYLREVLSGLGLTAAHFFRNMRLHVARAVGRRDARGAVTIQ